MMTKAVKKSASILLLAIVALAFAVPSAFAATWQNDYVFYYEEAYDAHSSSFIADDATIDDVAGTVTITLSGNYFPELVKGGVTYYGSYSGGVTTFVFPGNDSADIPISLHVVVPFVHNEWYDLEIHW